MLCEDLAAERNPVPRTSWQKSSMKLVTIGGTWFLSIYQPSVHHEKNVLLYFHGGGFVIGEGRSAVTGFAASVLSKSFGDAK